jgi:hypothetical protein
MQGITHFQQEKKPINNAGKHFSFLCPRTSPDLHLEGVLQTQWKGIIAEETS